MRSVRGRADRDPERPVRPGEGRQEVRLRVSAASLYWGLKNFTFNNCIKCSEEAGAGDVAIPEEGAQQQQQLSWFGFHVDEQTSKVTLSLVDEGIAYIARIVREQGPFDGVFGFSQGGTIASLVFQHQRTFFLIPWTICVMRSANWRWWYSMCACINNTDEKPEDWASTFQFGIFVSAPQSRDPNVGNPELRLEIPTLHMIGETDAVVAPESSKSLAAGFVEPKVFLHPGGHYIPTSKEPKDAFRDFFKQLKDVLAKQ